MGHNDQGGPGCSTRYFQVPTPSPHLLLPAPCLLFILRLLVGQGRLHLGVLRSKALHAQEGDAAGGCRAKLTHAVM